MGLLEANVKAAILKAAVTGATPDGGLVHLHLFAWFSLEPD